MKKTIFIKRLQKIPQTELLFDIKTYIKNTHGFYQHKVPEMNVMADKLHKEYSLNEFYSVFSRLWRRSNGERSLAIHTLELYHDAFDVNTWNFLRLKLQQIKSFDETKCMGDIISFIYIKNPSLKKEIIALSENKNIWVKRIGLLTIYHVVKQKKNEDNNLLIKVITNNISDVNEDIQIINEYLLTTIGKSKKDFLKKFILKNKNMPDLLFSMLTRKKKHLRKIRKLKKLNNTVNI